ncbi:MAG TPA: DUF4401 domain-containing protein [Allosphingosinicella sp.]|jgi:hypothetical protein
MNAEALWDRLSAEGLVEGGMPEPERSASPWFVRVMLGVAGWIAALFLIAFVGTGFAFIIEDAAFAAVAGAACCAGAFALFRVAGGNDFGEQFGLAISLVGQVLIAIGLADFLEMDDPAFWLVLAAVEAGLALAVPNFLHRLLAAGGAAVALALAVNQLSLHGLAAPLLCAALAWVWLEPKRWAGTGRIWRPIGYGLALALLLVETFRLFGAEQWFAGRAEAPGWFALHGPLLGRGLTAAILVWVAATLTLREQGQGAGRISAYTVGAAIIFGLLSLKAPGLASASLILLLGFAAGSRILVALGILSLLGFVAHFYYSLQASLLEKSGILALTGLLLLAAHFAIRFKFPTGAAADPDHA